MCSSPRPTSQWVCDYPQQCVSFIEQRYKFFLSFESSSCQDCYRKVFNPLNFDSVPVVFGPKRTIYETLAPSRSFIHVQDFPTLEALSSYLIHLDKNDDEYLTNFDWKRGLKVDKVNYQERGWC